VSTDLDRFFRYVAPGYDGDCWLWAGKRTNRGYPLFTLAGTNTLAHRWIYRQLVGEIPDELSVDHLCCISWCVNPYHFSLVPMSENNMLGGPAKGRRRTICRRGHLMTLENTKVTNGGKARTCRECVRLNKIASRERAAAARGAA
jgi:hypothetical protein